MVPGHLAVVDPHGIPAHHAGVWGFLGVVIKVLTGGMIVHGWYLIHSLLFPMTVKVSRPVGRVAGQAVGGQVGGGLGGVCRQGVIKEEGAEVRAAMDQGAKEVGEAAKEEGAKVQVAIELGAKEADSCGIPSPLVRPSCSLQHSW